MTDLTGAQRMALADAVATAALHGVRIHVRDFRISFTPESRPGRGHDIVAFFADSDHVVECYLDPYGHGDTMIGTVDWLHNGDPESDGNCERCEELESKP